MSQWTHVNGSIRVDTIRRVMPDLDFVSLFKTCTFNSSPEEWAACNVPCGSEGSIQFNIWDNPDKAHLAAYTINFFGDLRDYDDEKELVKWLQDTCRELGIVRDAIMSVDIESKSYSVYKINVMVGPDTAVYDVQKMV